MTVTVVRMVSMVSLTRAESMVSMCWKEVREGVQVSSFLARLMSPLSAAFRS